MFALSPPFVGRLAGPTAPPLDGFTANIWNACSIRQLLTAYAGNLIRVRRSSDNTEQDIGFTGYPGVLDTGALASFVGGGSGFIVTFYDQSGNGRNFAQSNTAKQPRIVNAGVYDGKIVFDGTDDCLTTGNMPGTNTAVTAFFRGTVPSPTGTFRVFLELTADANTNGGFVAYFDVAGTRYGLQSGLPASTNISFYGGAAGLPADTVHAWIGDRTQATAQTICALYRSGVVASLSSSTLGSNTGNYPVSNWNLGARNNGASLATVMDVKDVVIYVTNKTADVGPISGALG